MTTYMIPIVAGTIGVLLLDEQITWGMVASMALIIPVVGIINSKSHNKNTGVYT